MKEIEKIDSSTEEKIKKAARIVFYKKGFAATRTRDIAEEAGINVALLNYYFRTKQKLFDIIMLDALTGFLRKILVVLNDENKTLEVKVEEVVTGYIDMLTIEPEIPSFVLTELRNHPHFLLEKLPIKQAFKTSVFFKQYRQGVAEGIISEPNPLHFLMNLMSLTVFPFIAKPMLMEISGTKEAGFKKLMDERKQLIPIWIKAILLAK